MGKSEIGISRRQLIILLAAGAGSGGIAYHYLLSRDGIGRRASGQTATRTPQTLIPGQGFGLGGYGEGGYGE